MPSQQLRLFAPGALARRRRARVFVFERWSSADLFRRQTGLDAVDLVTRALTRLRAPRAPTPTPQALARRVTRAFVTGVGPVRSAALSSDAERRLAQVVTAWLDRGAKPWRRPARRRQPGSRPTDL